MGNPADSERKLRFATFEVDPSAGELRKQGINIKLQGQPFQLLVLLLERAGEVVTREELRQRLWPADTFVDFDNSLNAAMGKVRQALSDSAVNPRFIETVPRRGYRFLLQVERVHPVGPVPSGLTPDLEVSPPARHPKRRFWRPWVFSIVILLLAAIALGFTPAGSRLINKFRPNSNFGPIQSLAVLPLRNLSSDPQQNYFADGMTEALITDLARLPSIRVISRTSSMRYQDSPKLARDIARELNVDALVEGSVQRSGSKVRVTVQLIDGRTDRHIWAQNFDADMTDVLVLQNNTALAVAGQIHGALDPSVHARLSQSSTVDPDVYDMYLHGRSAFYLYTSAGTDEAIRWYQQALAKNPSFAPAHAGLALAYAQYRNIGADVDPAWPKRAESSARTAIRLDPTLSEGYFALGFNFMLSGEWDQARTAFQQALALEPNHAHALSGLGFIYVSTGFLQWAEDNSEAARRLDPYLGPPYWNLSLVRHAQGRHREALEIVENSPVGDSYLSAWVLTREAFELHDLERLRVLAASDLNRGWSPEAVAGAKALLEYASGHNAEGQERMRAVSPAKISDARGAELVASLCALAHDPESTLVWLQTAVSRGSTNYTLLANGEEFAFLRGDPRFQDLLKKTNASYEALKAIWK